MKNFILVFCLSVLLFGCKEKASEEPVDAVMVSESVAAEASADYSSSDQKSMAAAAPSKSETVVETKIIKNADLRFESADLEKTYKAIAINIKKTNAIVQSDSESKTDGGMFRNLTIRIPSKNFEMFIADLSKGVAYFDRKEISSKDVTAEYIDTDARIASKKKLEIRYLELLKKANKVTEMLEIETQLSTIREEIEAKEGQLKYLQSQVSMSTINIEFYKNMATESGVQVSFLSKFWNAIVSGFNSIGVFILNILEMWPIILIIIGVIVFIRKLRKAKRNK